jgi:hypothetical protein
MASLDRLLNDKEAESQLSTGLEMLREFVDNAASFSEEDQRQEQIASIHDAFHNCHGLDFHESHAGTVEQALVHLSQDAITTEKQATLGMVLASLSPQYTDRMDATHDDAKPWRSTEAWQKTSDALAIVALSQKVAQESGTSQAATNLEHEAGEALRTWKKKYPSPPSDGADGFLHEVLGGTKTHIEDSFKALEAFVTSRTVKTRTSKRVCLEQAVAAFEAVANGRTDGGSWKEKLNEKSGWDDIEREATYHFVFPDGSRMHNRIDTLYKDMHDEKAAYEKVFSDLAQSQVTQGGTLETMPQDILDRMAKAEEASAVTHTESTFFEILSSGGTDRTRKIQARMESMSKRNITSDQLQVGLWRKVLVVTAKRRKGPETPKPN